MDLSTAIELFFAERWDIAETTRSAYRNHLKHFLNFTGDRKIEDITSTIVKRYLAHAITELKLSRRTVSDSWIVISSLFSWAAKELNVTHPIKGGKVPRPKFQKKPVDVLTEDECKALIRHVASTKYTRANGTEVTMRRTTAIRDKAIILTLLDVGLRVSELCGLQVKDWSAERGRLLIREGKGRHGGKDRSVYVGNSCKSAIMRYCAYRGKLKDDAPLFATSTNSKLARSNIRNLLETVAKSAGIRQTGKGVHPHLLRHSFAVNFLRNGGNIRALQEILGHDDISTVQVYLHIVEQDLENSNEFSPADRMRL